MPKVQKRAPVTGRDQDIKQRVGLAVDAVLHVFHTTVKDATVVRLKDELNHAIWLRFRFAGKTEVQSARELLVEKGRPMWGDELVRELLLGGIYVEPTDAQGWTIVTGIIGSLSSAAAQRKSLIYVLGADQKRDHKKKLFGLPGRDEKFAGKPFPRPEEFL